MVFQSYALYPHMTVYDNLAFSLKNFGVRKAEIERRVRDAAQVLELGELLKRKPRQLSGGQRQRVALGRAIVREPSGFLMDEPLSNLDAALRAQTRSEILKLQRRLGTTTIYVTHDQVEAMTMGDRIAVMSAGVLQQIGTPEELYTRPANTFVARFIGSPAMNLLPSTTIGVGAKGQLVGFRPEHVQLGAGRNGAVSYDAVVEVVEYLGDEQLAHLRLDGQEIIAKLPVEPRLHAGEAETFSVQLQKVFLFDGDSNQAVGAAA
jgi:ABC-type sugar transport system ATPase subunit